MSAANRLRQLERTIPADAFIFGTDAEQRVAQTIRNALPALADVVEAAQAWAHYKHAPADPRDDDLHDALARLEAQLGKAEE